MIDDALTSDYIRAAMTTPPHDVSIEDLMAAGASGFFRVPFRPKVPKGSARNRRRTRTRRLQALRRSRRIEAIEDASWVIQSVDVETMTVTVRVPCVVTVRPWGAWKDEPIQRG